MLKCKDVTDETSNYIEGALSFGKRIAMFLHLMICRNCRHYVQQFQSTIDAVETSQPQEMDETDRKALAKKLHAMCQKTNSGEH